MRMRHRHRLQRKRALDSDPPSFARAHVQKPSKIFEGSHRPTTWVIKCRHCWIRDALHAHEGSETLVHWTTRINQENSRNASSRWLRQLLKSFHKYEAFIIPSQIDQQLQETFRNNTGTKRFPFLESEPECTRMQETQVCRRMQVANAWKGEPQHGKFLDWKLFLNVWGPRNNKLSQVTAYLFLGPKLLRFLFFKS